MYIQHKCYCLPTERAICNGKFPALKKMNTMIGTFFFHQESLNENNIISSFFFYVEREEDLQIKGNTSLCSSFLCHYSQFSS